MGKLFWQVVKLFWQVWSPPDNPIQSERVKRANSWYQKRTRREILFIDSQIQSPKSGNNFIVPLNLDADWSSPALVISRRSVTKSSEVICHQDLKSWDLRSKVPILTAEISYYLSCPTPFMGWTSLFQAFCIFQISNLPWLRPKVRRLKVRGSKVHVFDWCLISLLA